MKLTLAKVLARNKVDPVSTSCFVFTFLPARGNFCCLLNTFANSLDPDLDPKCLTPGWY